MQLRDSIIDLILHRSPGLFDDIEALDSEIRLIKSVVISTVDFCIEGLYGSAPKAVTEEEVTEAMEKIMPELKAMLLVFIEGLKASCDVAWRESC